MPGLLCIVRSAVQQGAGRHDERTPAALSFSQRPQRRGRRRRAEGPAAAPMGCAAARALLGSSSGLSSLSSSSMPFMSYSGGGGRCFGWRSGDSTAVGGINLLLRCAASSSFSLAAGSESQRRQISRGDRNRARRRASRPGRRTIPPLPTCLSSADPGLSSHAATLRSSTPSPRAVIARRAASQGGARATSA